MVRTIRAHKVPIVLAALVLALFGLVQGVLGGGIDPNDKWAWSTNVGWINFDPAGSEQVTIDRASGEFDGYAWGENMGWIHLRGTGVVEYGVSRLMHHIYLPLVLRGS